MENTMWKFTMESIVHNEFADARINCFRDLYVFALLRFGTVKKAYVLFSSFWFYKCYYFCE